MNNSKFIDETGNKYGKLTVIAREQNTIYGTAKWLCKCECGNTRECRGQDLRSGRITHCGCEKKPKRITNYFKIKQMTVDEMAEWILTNKLEKCKVCICKPNGMKKSKECKKYKNCDTPIFLGLKQWLLQEVEE